MKKVFLIGMIMLLGAGFLFADDASAAVDMDILSKATRETYIEDNSSVAWKDYNTGKQIRDMGRRLGAEVRYQAEVNGTLYPFSSGYPDYKYKAARVFPGKKAGADVIYLGRLSKLGTFKNLNRVVSGYIEKAYGVSMEQADQIAMKVCYWNTNHYNDKSYFKENFEVRVLEVFENRTKTIGLARSYKNWPGNARIVIPFTIVQEVAPKAVEPVAPKIEEQPKPAPVVEPVKEEKTVVAEPPKTETVQTPSRTTQSSQNSNEKSAAAKSGKINPLIFIIGGAALLVVILIIVIVAASKKKKQNEELENM